MNSYLKAGLLLQIPNVIILVILAFVFIVPLLTLATFLWIIVGSIYAIVNLISLFLIVMGLVERGNK
jgi:hypothetical protein